MSTYLHPFFISLLVSINLFAVHAKEPSHLASILSKHQQSLGELDAWRSVNSVTYLLNIKEPTFELQGVYRATRSGKMRIDIYANGERVFTEGYNGQVGWEWSPKENSAQRLDQTKTAALRHGVQLPGHIFTLLDMDNNGQQLEYIESREHQGLTVDVLRLTLKDGHQKFYFLDSHSGQIVAKRDKRAFHPNIDETKVMVESRPSDFRLINGMRRPYKTQNYDLTFDKWLGLTQVLGIQFDETIPADYFEPNNKPGIKFSDG